MKTILGIDFGTTTTAIGMTSEASRFEPELVEVDGITTVESVLRLDPAGERVEQIGREAWEEISLYPDRTFYAFKSKTGVNYEYKFGAAGRVFTGKDLGVLFLRVIREKIERQQFNGVSLKDSDVTCVIGYPAEWSDKQKSLIVGVAEEAGFPNVVGCEEPLGVVYYHHFKGDLSVNKDQIILVYDFGGGTTDVAIVRTSKGELPEIIGFGGIDLGGHHFDENLRQIFSAKMSMSLGMAQLTPSDQALTKRYSRMIKEKLSVAQDGGSDKAEITIPMLETSKSHYRMALDAEEFERQCENFIKRFDEPVDAALLKSGIGKNEIDVVITAGGSGRLHYVREKIKSAFPDSLKIQSTNPQEVISKGLAIFGRVKEIGDAPEAAQGGELIIREDPGLPAKKDELRKFPPEDEKKKGKKFGKVILALAAVVVLGLAGAVFTMMNQGKGKVGPEKQQKAEYQADESVKKAFSQLVSAFQKAAEGDVSALKAAESDVRKIDLKGMPKDLEDFKNSLGSFFTMGLELENQYQYISKGTNPCLYEWNLDKEDTLDQETVPQCLKLNNFLIEQWTNQGIANFTADSLNLERPFETVGVYEIKLTQLELPESFKWADKMSKPDPVVFLGVALDNRFFPMYQTSKSEDTYNAFFGDHDTWFVPKRFDMVIVVYDWDESLGDMLDYVVVPKENHSGWLKMQKGCKIDFSVKYSDL